MIIAIDGPAGSGKSSTARVVAQRLGFLHLDTGAMYRCITLKCLKNNIAYTDKQRLYECVKTTNIQFTNVPPHQCVWMDGVDVSVEIRSETITNHVSDYCAPTVVREQLVEQQRLIGSQHSVVCEGRDIGTVVFPHAELKFFMVASVIERARRRQKDFAKMSIYKSIEELVEQITERDNKDSVRENSPLKKAPDAEQLDTTHMTLDEQVEYILYRVRQVTVQP